MKTPTPAMRARYMADSVATASPAKLLMMLFDRLLLDLARGEQALLAGDRPAANTQLLHAQDIVSELHMTLTMGTWDGAASLAQLYTFVVSELIGANVQGDAARVNSCRSLIEPLRDAWREASRSGSAVTG